jgi:hypothetical protein
MKTQTHSSLQIFLMICLFCRNVIPCSWITFKQNHICRKNQYEHRERKRARGETGGRHREREREREHACCRCSFTCTLFLMPSISSNTPRSMDCRYLREREALTRAVAEDTSATEDVVQAERWAWSIAQALRT